MIALLIYHIYFAYFILKTGLLIIQIIYLANKHLTY